MKKEKNIRLFLDDKCLYFKKRIYDFKTKSHYDLVKFGDLKYNRLTEYSDFNNSIKYIDDIEIESDRIIVKFDESSIILNIYLTEEKCIWEFILMPSDRDNFLIINPELICVGEYNQNEYNLEKLISILCNMML